MAAESQAGPWVPLVTEGPLAKRIEDALAEMGAVLAWRDGAAPEAAGAGAAEGASAGGGEAGAGEGAGGGGEDAAAAAGAGRGLSLAGGPAGQAVFFHYLDRARPGRQYDERALELLEAAIDSSSQNAVLPTLYGGFSGTAWTLEHLTGRLLDAPEPGDEDPGAEVAEALGGFLARTPWKDEYDLIGGLVGYGVWALERAPRPGGAEAAASVVARLAESGVRRDGGITWWTPPERMGPSAAEFPDGYYNLGVAHGVPGVIGVLGEMCAAGLGGAAAGPLLDDAVAWFLAQRLPAGSSSAYGYSVSPSGQSLPSRLAWCYGDAGIALTLLGAARATGNAAWEEEALAVARAAAARPHDQVGIRDGGLCHGSAGLAHLYNRLFQATREPVFKDQALAWLEQLFEYYQPGQGSAGWHAWGPLGDVLVPNPEMGWRADAGFLTGAAGIGLALAAAVSPVEPAWDRLLLAAVPPR